MNDQCIFCKLVAGEIPSTRVYEDDHVLAFMDISPIIKGHVLVIPKEHIDPITSASDALLHQLITTTRSVAEAVSKGLQADGINIIQNNGTAAGQDVPHLHFHVIPRFKNDGHHWNWNTSSYGNPSDMEDLAAKIRTQF